eukprot:PhM_4_TR8439/c1_g1_i1/m.3964
MPPKKATKKGSKSKRIAHNAQAMVISGFLGAGKTTLVEAMLKTPPAGATIAVLVNDLAAINIDGSQIKKSTDDMVELTNGCICCDLRGELMEQLLAVHGKKKFTHIVIECTGVADPMQVAETFFLPTGIKEDPDITLEKLGLKLASCVTVVDASAFHDNIFCFHPHLRSCHSQPH